MKAYAYIIVCFAVSYTLLSCKTQIPESPSYYSDLSEDELREMRERNQAKALDYLKQLESSAPDSVTMISFDWTGCSTSPDFSKYNKVRVVEFSGIEMKSVDKSLFSSDSLQTVVLNRCSFRKVDFPDDNHISRLNLTNCNLTRIPTCIRRCKQLKELNLEGNNIRHIPGWIMRLDSLEEVNLNFNQLKLSRSDVKHLSKAKQILVAGNSIEKLPKNIGQLHCEKMNLAKNKLNSLPKSFASLDNMTLLIFYENNFEEIPDVLAGFKNLKHLDFYKNNLKEIPDFVGDMRDMEQLYLSYNNIEVIPDTLRNLKSLKYFYIHHNDLHFLPEWIIEMDSLERLGVGFNRLLDLPDLSKMKALREFDAEHNLLENFPWKLVEKPCLDMLILRDNDFKLSFEEKMRLIKASKRVNIIY